MLEIFKIVVLFTIAITVWTAFLLLQDKRGNKVLNRWFAAFLLLLTSPQMSLYAEQVVPGGVYGLSIAACTFLWLKGPFVWTFIKVLTRTEISIRSHWIHFVPWLAALIALIISPQFIQIIILLGMGHMLGYLVFALWRLVRRRHYVTEVWEGFQNSAYYWLLYVIGGLMALVAVDLVVMSLVFSGRLSTFDLLDYFAFPSFSVFVFSVGILSVYRPELMFREKPSEQSGESVEQNIAVDQQLSFSEKTSLDQKERHLELDVSLAQGLRQQLTQLMQEQQLYRQNELSLPDLALTLGISVHQVSELLNVHCGLSFYDYVSGYRLKYACDLLADPNCYLRILDIAFEAGFNNKNSFYRVFKESLGVTPNQFRSEALALDKTKSLSSAAI
jgi:AraC-like DNA-binding protein